MRDTIVSKAKDFANTLALEDMRMGINRGKVSLANLVCCFTNNMEARSTAHLEYDRTIEAYKN